MGVMQAVLFVLCAVDGLCTILGVPYTDTVLNLIVGNVLSGLFFVPLAMTLIFAWKTWDEEPVKLVRLWALVVILGTLATMILSLLIPSTTVNYILWLLWTVLNLPTVNCSILALPIFAWSLLLVGSHTMLRKMRYK